MATKGRPNDRLRLERRKRGWTQNDLVDEIYRVARERQLPEPKGLDPNYISRYERGTNDPSPHLVHLLCLAFGFSSDQLGLPGETAPGQAATPVRAAAMGAPGIESGPLAADTRSRDEVSTITAWLEETNTSNGALEQIERATVSLAVAHADAPARRVLDQALRIHRQTQDLLGSGKQRLRQTRELLRIESNLLAHICLLLGDLGRDDRASQYGMAAQLYAHEAGADEAIAWSARAKTARCYGLLQHRPSASRPHRRSPWHSPAGAADHH